MKQALADTIGALVLFRGREQCADLDAALTRFEVAELSPETRRLIDRHAAGCEACRERRRKLASPFAILAAFAPIPAEAGVKEAILDAVAGTPLAAGGSDDGSASEDGEALAADEGTDLDFDASGDDDALEGLPLDAASGPAWDDLETDHLGRRRRRYTLAGVAIALLALLGIGGPVGALALLNARNDGGSPSAATVAAALATTTSAQQAGGAGATPAPKSLPIEVTATPTPIAVEGAATTPPLADRGGTTPTSTPVAVTDGAQSPPLAAPPASTPEPGGGSTAPGGSLLPPPDVTETPVTADPSGCTPTLMVTPAQLSFGAPTSAGTATVAGNGCGSFLPFTVTPDSDWIAVVPRSGSVAPGAIAVLTIAVSGTGREARTGRIEVSSPAGTQEITVTVAAAPEPAPSATPTVAPTPRPTRTPDVCSAIVCPTPTTPNALGGFVTP
jgi:hypothetical protein